MRSVGCGAAFGGLPARQVVAKAGPHPARELVPSPQGYQPRQDSPVVPQRAP